MKKNFTIIILSLSSFISLKTFSQVTYPCGKYFIELHGTSSDGGAWNQVYNSPDITLAAWIQLTDASFGGKRMDIFNRYDFDSGENTDFSLSINESGQVVFKARLNDPTKAFAFDSVLFNLKPEIGKWYHIAVTFDGATYLCKTYVNAELTNSKGFAGGLSYIITGSAYSHSMTFGFKDGKNAGYSNFFRGYIDEAAYCQTVLTESQVKTLAIGLMPGDQFIIDNRVAVYHKFDDYPSQPNYGTYKGTLASSGEFHSCPITLNTHIIDPNPDMIQSDGTLNKDQSKINLKSTVKGAATDGVTKLLLIADAADPITFSLGNPKDGTLYSLDDQHTLKTQISITPLNGKAVCVYEAPDGYGVDNPNGGRSINVMAYYTSDNSHRTDIPIQLVTPPVVLVHGMWSDPKGAWIDGRFQDYLQNHGVTSVYLADYSSANAETFDPQSLLSQTARDAIFTQISNALIDARNNNIVVSQVDIVGHSLGGLQARSFSQDPRFLSYNNYYKGYFHKLITIGTPHLGSSEGPILYYGDKAIAQILNEFPPYNIIYAKVSKLVGIITKKKIGSCHYDFNPLYKFNPFKGIVDSILNPLATAFSNELNHLAGTDILSIQFPGSGGLSNLNATTLFKVHAIATRWDAPGENSSNGWFKYLSIIAGNFLTDHLLGDSLSDLVVPKYSQLGGLQNSDYFDFYNNTSHSGLFGIISQTGNPDIQKRVDTLLLTDDVTIFSSGFPSPRNVSTPFDHYFTGDRIRNNFRQQSNKETNGTTGSFTNDTLRIISPIANEIFKNDGEDSITLRLTFTDSTKLANSVFVVEDNGFIAIPKTAPFAVKIPIPNSTVGGKLHILALVSDINGNIYADSLSVIISSSDTLVSVSASPQKISLDSNNRQTKINVTGIFRNGNNVVSRDISSTESGTTYTTKYGNLFITVDHNGIVSGNKNGIDTVTIQNSSLSTTVLLNVDTTLFEVHKFPNGIAFNVSDQSINNPPFTLNATDSSGEDIIYTLISGPITLNNDVVTINNTGTVVIKASSPGNAYFDSAASVTRSFHITNALPLNLLNFSGSLNNEKEVSLNWQTAQEINTSQFVVERSTNGTDFSAIGKVNAAGNSSVGKTYSFVDNKPLTGSNFYRLKMVDVDGKFTYSKIVALNNDDKSVFTLYPNPANDLLYLKVNRAAENVLLQIFDVTGRTIKEENVLLNPQSPHVINIKSLPKGVYELSVQSKALNVHQKFIKQ